MHLQLEASHEDYVRLLETLPTRSDFRAFFLEPADDHPQAADPCSICFENFSVPLNHIPVLLTGNTRCVGHVFGSHCISQWLTSHDSCPLCRTVLYQAPSDDDILDGVRLNPMQIASLREQHREMAGTGKFPEFFDCAWIKHTGFVYTVDGRLTEKGLEDMVATMWTSIWENSDMYRQACYTRATNFSLAVDLLLPFEPEVTLDDAAIDNAKLYIPPPTSWENHTKHHARMFWEHYVDSCLFEDEIWVKVAGIANAMLLRIKRICMLGKSEDDIECPALSRKMEEIYLGMLKEAVGSKWLGC